MRKIRIGILASDPTQFAPWELRLFEKIACDERFEIAALIIDGRSKADVALGSIKKPSGKNYLDQLPSAIIKWIDGKFAGNYPSYQAARFAPQMAAMERIIVYPKRQGCMDVFTSAESVCIKALRLDVLLRHGFGVILGPILEAAAHGIWSLHCGDSGVNRGGPAGYWECARRDPVTGVTLQRLTSTPGRARVIARAWYNTQFNSVRNQRSVAEKSVSLVWRELERLARMGGIVTMPSPLYSEPLFVAPRIGEALAYGAQRAKDVAREKLKDLRQSLGLRPHMWTLAFGRGVFEEAELWRTIEVVPPAHRYWADPFLLKKDGTTYIFFEDYSYKTHRAHISVARVQDGRVENVETAIDAGYHMSFPFVLEYDGQIYMIPETNVNNRVEVWRATDFPSKWELHSTALEGQSVADTLIHQRNGQWWMFTNVSPFPIVDHCCELHVFAIDGPNLKSVIPHRGNPVVIDSRNARNAGRIFTRNGRSFRPSQNNSHGIYGYGLNVMEINALTLDCYEETIFQCAEPHFKKGLVGCHHVDASDDLFVIDICRRVGGRGRIG